MTFLPDKQYSQKNKGRIAEKFINNGDKGGYSGVVIYTHSILGVPIKVSRYINGNQIDGVFLLDESKDKMKQYVYRAGKIIGNISLACKEAVSMTRSGGEDDWLEDWKHVFFMDDDIDGDGDYDFMDWFSKNLFGLLPDGTKLTFDYDDDFGDWSLRDQYGVHYNIPSEFQFGAPSNEPEDDRLVGLNPDGGQGGGFEDGDGLSIEIPYRCKYCHRIIGYLPMDCIGVMTFYCPSCKSTYNVQWE